MIEVQSIRRFQGWLVILFVFLVPGILIASASAADATITAYVGDAIIIQGNSYVGDQVYLFLTGPNLPADGVTLNDVTLRADQGQFTILGLDSDQHFSMRWDTSRIRPRLDPGTYTVYISTQPVDLSHLGGSSTYQTLQVYLQDSGNQQTSVGPGTYTMNPEMHTSTLSPTLVIPSRTPTTLPTTAPPETTVTTVSPTTPIPQPTKAASQPWIGIIAILSLAGILRFR